MKSILTLVMFFSLLTGINANHNKATVIIKSANNLPIIVELDNRHNEYARTVHKFENIRSGTHYVKILKPRNRYHPHHGAQLIYNGRIRAYNGYKVVYKIDCGRLILVKKQPHQYHYGPTSGSCPNHGHCNNSSCGCNTYGGGHGGSNGSGCNTGYSDYYGHNNGNWHYGNGHHNQHYPNNQGHYNDDHDDDHYYGPRNNYDSYGHKKSIPQSKFNQLIQGVKHVQNDSGKVRYIKSQLSNETVSSSQVRIILGELFFEGNKVEVAKYLYPKTSDQDQFSQVMDEFYFSSSKKEISKLITYKK